MSEIKYQTEGKAQIDCEIGNAKPCAFSWQKGGITARLYQGASTTELSRSQLVQIAQLASAIALDLALPGDQDPEQLP